MGQQQLLLVILVTIIVGIATVVAINTFGSAANNANKDAVRNDISQIAASAQGYYMKPSTMGGGGHKFNGIGFSNLAFASQQQINDGSETSITNENGTYTLAGSADNLKITAEPAQAGGEFKAYVESDCLNISDYGKETATQPTACTESN